MAIATQEEYWQAHVDALNAIAAAIARRAVVDEERWAAYQATDTTPSKTQEEIDREMKRLAVMDAQLDLQQAEFDAKQHELVDALNVGHHINDIANYILQGVMTISNVPVDWQAQVQSVVDARQTP
jgi:hypothetical protein